MDGFRFDRLTKLMATPRPRRTVLKALGGGLVGVLAAVTGAKPDTVARKSHHADTRKQRVSKEGPPQKHCKFQGYGCRNNTNCCSLNCCNRTCCGEGQTCVGGQCVAACPESLAQTCGTQKCGTKINSCQQLVNCGSLCTAANGTCLENDTCASSCSSGLASCAATCYDFACFGPNIEGQAMCLPDPPGTADCNSSIGCSRTKDCPQGQECLANFPCAGQPGFCVTVCTV